MLELELISKPFSELASIETHLLFVVILALLVRHTHGLLCTILGLPENWIVLLVRLLTRRL